MAAWLSSNISIVGGSLKIFRSHTASWAAAQALMYSASAVERAIVGWRLLHQERGAFRDMKMYPVMDFRSSGFEAQSASA